MAAGSTFVGKLFSYKGATPTPLENRIYTDTSTAYLTEVADISTSTLASYGYTGPIAEPAHDKSTHKLVWNSSSSAYVVTALSTSEKDTLWTSKRAELATEIGKLRTLANNRKNAITAAGKATTAVDKFLTRLATAEASSDNPYEIVLPDPLILYTETSSVSSYIPNSYEWAIANYSSNLDHGYVCDVGAQIDSLRIEDKTRFDAFIAANKNAILLDHMGSSFNVMAYPISYQDKLDGTGEITIELAGNPASFKSKIGSANEVSNATSVSKLTLSGSGSHEVTLTAVNSAGQDGKPYTHTFTVS